MRTRTRRLLAALVAVAVVPSAGVLAADAVAVSRDEVRMSERIRAATPGVPAPAVTLGGAPVVSRERREGSASYPSLAARVEGVRRPVVGPVVVTLSATDVRVPSDPAATPALGDARVSVLLTGDAIGRALGLDSVLLGNADDSSLAGGTERVARITGREPGTGDEVTGLVRLVVDPSGARLEPADPGGPDAGRLGLRLPRDLLPAGAPVTDLTVRGGTITATGAVPGPVADPARLAEDVRG